MTYFRDASPLQIFLKGRLFTEWVAPVKPLDGFSPSQVGLRTIRPGNLGEKQKHDLPPSGGRRGKMEVDVLLK